ncbi:hypothetical protein [Oceanibaculum nanhaiense]|uniref:hypothetical protein n=1 Tax=Oceanibaculum nanhaiense TaxID=1909734 RepID=UPI000A374707|nr:hypothetical protein [Oceanibaculum nanhaiense]
MLLQRRKRWLDKAAELGRGNGDSPFSRTFAIRLRLPANDNARPARKGMWPRIAVIGTAALIMAAVFYIF